VRLDYLKSYLLLKYTTKCETVANVTKKTIIEHTTTNTMRHGGWTICNTENVSQR